MDADEKANAANLPDAIGKPLAREGYHLIGAAIEVHRELGGGLLEEVYQQALEWELRLRNIPFSSKRRLRVHYKTHELDLTYIPDLIVYERIIVELKSVNGLAPEHEAQLFNYMRLTQCPVGYLINFGPIGKAEWRRFVLSEFA